MTRINCRPPEDSYHLLRVRLKRYQTKDWMRRFSYLWTWIREKHNAAEIKQKIQLHFYQRHNRAKAPWEEQRAGWLPLQLICLCK